MQFPLILRELPDCPFPTLSLEDPVTIACLLNIGSELILAHSELKQYDSATCLLLLTALKLQDF